MSSSVDRESGFGIGPRVVVVVGAAIAALGAVAAVRRVRSRRSVAVDPVLRGDISNIAEVLDLIERERALLEADPDDRTEMEAVTAVMEALRGPG